MNKSIRLLSTLLWVSCLGVFIWSLNLSGFNFSHQNRNEELQKIQDSLQKLQNVLVQGSNEAKFSASIHENLRIVREGTQTLEENAVSTLSFLALISLGIASLLIFVGPDQKLRLTKKAEPKTDNLEPVNWYIQQLEQISDDLKSASHVLGGLKYERNSGSIHRNNSHDLQMEQVIQNESQLLRMRQEIHETLSTIRDLSEKLQRLTTQSEDNSLFAAATRLDWSSMGGKLRLIKENQDRIKITAEKVAKQQTNSYESLNKALDFEVVYGKNSEIARGQFVRVHQISRDTLKDAEGLAHSMAESNQDVSTASKLVRGLSERAEEIVNIIDVIDDIAEQTNQLALNASIEAARAGEQGQGFAVVAGEVRNLAARSSTATKSITDLLGTIQQEADQASRRLEKSKISVETAHHRMLELDRSFREAVSLSHLALNQLLEMDNDSDAHLQNLKQSDKQLHELQKFSSRLATLLLDHEKLVDATYADAKQLTLHSDRLSRILTRQFFEVSHCDRLVEGTHVSLDRLNLKLEEGINQADKLRTGLNHNFQKNSDTQSGGEQPSAQIARVAELIKSCHTSLEIICSPAELARSQLKGIYEEIALESQQNGRDPSPSQQALELEPIGAILLNSDVIPISNLETEQKVS